MKIYTRQGDYGMTSTVTGEKISKYSTLMDIQGSIDEINSCTGHIRALISKYNTIGDAKDEIENTIDVQQRSNQLVQLDLRLKEIQYLLFCVGADISSGFEKKLITLEHITSLEQDIDAMTELTGTLNSFIYLSGHETASNTHVVRSITRRAERSFVGYIESLLALNSINEVPLDYRFINRLADYYFQTARYLNYLFNVEEEKMHLK